ncbi:putative som1 protein [Rosellinia necatrix]|uniref:Putative som1 protein n=1 Tax=Rosellinia necatrix TaxID=77044 RepID=A0A1S7UJ28_ROSNE|nr:putative som1 protein [Rosellinia necatrix]
MNNINMANMPMAGGPVGGGPMTMMANNTLAGGQVQRPPENNHANLNTYIYDYFLREGMFDCARAMLNSERALNVHKNPRRDENGNVIGNGIGDDPMDTDSKDDLDTKRPSDLPAPNVPNGSDSCFLYEWFCLFWDMLSAQRNKGGVSAHVSQYVAHTQGRLRQSHNQQQEMMRHQQMRPELYTMGIQQRLQNGLAMNPKHAGANLARTAMANNQNPQMQMLQAAKQNQMQRDGNNIDGNQNRPASPGSAEGAPSPSKRPRMEGAGPFNAQQVNMMNGQRQQGMPAQQVGDTKAAIAQQMLLLNGNPVANLTTQQFREFPPSANQAKVQAYSQGLQQHHSQQIPNKQVPNPGGPQGQGSPMIAQGPENAAALGAFYPEMGPNGMRPGGPGPTQGGGSNHALQDYQMQLMLLEQQNKKRLMMARQEQDNMGGGMPRDGSGPGGPGGPGGPPGPNGQPFQDASPQGVRPGASPNPNEQIKRGTPQLGPTGIPSPLPEGAQSRGSPNAMNFIPNGMDPNMQQNFLKGMSGMDGNMVAMNAGMRPPSSHPNASFNPQMNPQFMARQQGAPQQIPWQGPNGNGMAPQGPQGPQGQVQGTPQQRAMPPPSAPAPVVNGNGRTNTSSPQTSTAAPQTPQLTNKAAPKKKDGKATKTKAAAQKNKAPPAGATPVPEPSQDAEPPAPATPITPSSTAFKPGQNAAAVQPTTNVPASVPQTAPAQIAAPPVDQMNFADMNSNGAMFANNLEFSELGSADVLQDFDFDSFLHDGDEANGAFDFNAAPFGMEQPGEIGAE